jgi:hypothetical protein
VFLNGSSVFRPSPWLLAGSHGSVSLLSSATMRRLRLPLSISGASLPSAPDTFSCLVVSLTSVAKSLSEVPGLCSTSCSLSSGSFRKGDRRISQVSRQPFRSFALLLDPGRTIALGFSALWCCSRLDNNESSCNDDISRLIHTAFGHAAYA